MTMLSKLLAMSRSELKNKLQAVDTAAVKDRGLRRKFEKIRAKQGGFTLLELLVVVLILAAISGTATIMLQDTDRKNAAGAHVAMMDELSKGIQTFRVLNNAYPDVWDSLFASSGGVLTGANPLAIISTDLFETGGANLDEDVFVADDIKALNTVGIRRVRVVDTDAEPEGFATGVRTCENSRDDDGIGGLIRSKLTDVTAQNIFRVATANGCGAENNVQFANGDPVMVWAGDPQRVGVPIGASVYGSSSATNENKLIAFGIGPDSTLFSPSQLGSMSNTPVYRHVAADEYNRFIVLFNVNPTKVIMAETATPGVFAEDEQSAGGQAIFQAIIDGAGDTKDEELGELDGMRPT
ncbi:MAG: prepilin-type N-terminal cleavage/methylation domain-containing protein [Azoarcus sp.]|jgi:prepilin-type N-terminal cleavage/methylation domain-containing protein|nr:prepilin-type N-terminal cleavage/methylation domain-containing protein [Azoarcus sp.]